MVVADIGGCGALDDVDAVGIGGDVVLPQSRPAGQVLQALPLIPQTHPLVHTAHLYERFSHCYYYQHSFSHCCRRSLPGQQSGLPDLHRA